MKKAILSALSVLANQILLAENVVQPGTMPPNPPSGNFFDTAAIIIGSLALSGLIFYLIYIRIADTGFWAKRKREIRKSSSH